MKKAIIIIPAYNEEKNIAGVINGIKNVIPDASILVINDGGEDRTEEIARELGVRVISLPCNMGYGTALQTGFKFALKKGYEYAVQIDADGQHDPKGIPKLLDEVFNKADVIIGLQRVQNIFEELVNIFPMTSVVDLDNVALMNNFINNSKSFCF